MGAVHERVNQLDAAAFQRLQHFMQAQLADVFPSAALAVIWRDTLILDVAWAGDGHSTTADTLFDLASVSKLFTTTAFLRLVSEGAVGLDDCVVKVIPEFGAGGLRDIDGGQDPHSRVMLPTPAELLGQQVDPTRVTFRHLLTHTSGLPPWRAVFQVAGDIPPPPTERDPYPSEQRSRNALRAICAYPFVGQPDGTIRYSDIGLMLIGESIVRLEGAPLDKVIQQRVTDPVGLRSVTYNPLQHGYSLAQIAPTEDDRLWRMRRCWGEVHDENACGLGGIAGHAGLFACARDVAAFGYAWLQRDQRLGELPFAEAVREQARSGDERRGLGWLLKARQQSSAGERFSPDSYGHTGFTGTSLWIDPSQSLVVACLTNRVYDGREKMGIIAFRRALHDLIVDILV
ncbi:MAG: beta-lactamase family protein [Anaerolineae bacterium]|nr:beta-lactamase family protein [Anaerolineae bacterium]